MNTKDVMRVARKNLNDSASARLCFEDAVTFEQAGDLQAAKNAAIKSLRYSVGILHEDYKAVVA